VGGFISSQMQCAIEHVSEFCSVFSFVYSVHKNVKEEYVILYHKIGARRDGQYSFVDQMSQ
jgi:hypothetical protein